MDLSRIKNLVKQNGHRVILVEGGEPEIVVMTFGEYEKLTAAGIGASVKEKADSGSFQETEFIPPQAPEAAFSHTRLEDITLDDLPLL